MKNFGDLIQAYVCAFEGTSQSVCGKLWTGAETGWESRGVPAAFLSIVSVIGAAFVAGASDGTVVGIGAWRTAPAPGS